MSEEELRAIAQMWPLDGAALEVTACYAADGSATLDEAAIRGATAVTEKANRHIGVLMDEVRQLRAVLGRVFDDAELFGSWGDNTYTLSESAYEVMRSALKWRELRND